MEPGEEGVLTLQVVGYSLGGTPPRERGTVLVLHTTRGDIPCLFHAPARGTRSAVLWVWGARGGYAGPAGLYRRLAEDLAGEGIASLRVDYRYPGFLEESVMDVLAGATFLKGVGFRRVALVGHSFGGAVVIASAPFCDAVCAVVALSPQTYGAQFADRVSPRPLLLVHGEADEVLPPECSRRIYAWAREPKELVLYPGAGHRLQECAEEVYALLRSWLPQRLGVAPTGQEG